MSSFWTTQIGGNLTRDPEVRQAGKSSVCELGVAVNYRKKRGDEWVDDVMFPKVVLWGQNAEFAGKYCRKGSFVWATGRVEEDKWTDKKDGSARKEIRIIADQFGLGSGQKSDVAPQSEKPATVTQAVQESLPDDDEIPF